jgi:hypothetical protein
MAGGEEGVRDILEIVRQIRAKNFGQLNNRFRRGRVQLTDIASVASDQGSRHEFNGFPVFILKEALSL